MTHAIRPTSSAIGSAIPLAELAIRVQGTMRGPEAGRLTSATSLEEAGPEDLSFCGDIGQLARALKSAAGVILTTGEIADAIFKTQPRTVLVVAKPQDAFLELIELFRRLPERPFSGISPAAHVQSGAVLGPDCHVGPGAFIAADARLGARCIIYPGAYIGPECVLGDDVTLHPNAVLYFRVSLGDRTQIHANATIGADGFGYRFAGGQFHKIPQYGGVEIAADVELGAGTTVDRGALAATRIGRGTKIDNQVMIAHNCQIGAHNVFASQVGLAGSCETGDYVRLAGQVGIRDHVTLHKGSTVGAKSGVYKDIPAGETWVGYPAIPEQDQMRLVFTLQRAPEMRKDIKSLEKQVAQLQQQLATIIAAQSANRAA